MELTRECLAIITEAARELNAGSLTITIQARPEDSRYFDLKVAHEKRYRIGRNNADTKPAQHNR